MSDIYADLRMRTAEAIRTALKEISSNADSDLIHGFALCTDDDVMTLFSAACTKSWVADRSDDYEAIGFIYTEWEEDAGDSHFDSISESIADMADADDSESASERRFESLVLALKDCREEGIFDEDTLLCCGSTDPMDEMERLAMLAVERLNTVANADLFAKHLGYEEYRKENG
ncbi:MAG: DUF4303 domain-containing protein [Planctomycetota bacterium]